MTCPSPCGKSNSFQSAEFFCSLTSSSQDCLFQGRRIRSLAKTGVTVARKLLSLDMMCGKLAKMPGREEEVRDQIALPVKIGRVLPFAFMLGGHVGFCLAEG